MASSALIAYSDVEAIDAELLRLSRGMAALRLLIGDALEALAVSAGHHQLGFSSLEAFVRERCERSGRWAADTRALARRLRRLPHLRRVLRQGELGWSVVELLARHVTPATELAWLERARNVTVRELRELLRKEHGPEASVDEPDLDEHAHLLTVTVYREDAWYFECARRVAEQLGCATSANEILQAMLAECLSTIVELAPESAQDDISQLAALEEQFEDERRAQAEWCAQRERWRKEAEALCRRAAAAVATISDVPEPALPDTPEHLDRELRRWCQELAERDLALGLAAQRARHADVWRRLGFASEEHYARERLGVSLSSLKIKRALAARTLRLPELRTAVTGGSVGFEAAYLLSRVATPATIHDWIDRARERTLKHLREEVEAADLFVHFGYGRDQPPPSNDTMEQFFEIERIVAGGETLDGADVSRLFGGGRMDPTSQTSGGQTRSRGPSRSERARGRVTFRWHVSASTARFWRSLERLFARVGPAIGVKVSFLRFVAESFCRIWLPAIRRRRLTLTGEEPAYFEVYRRDAFRCTSPVCSRRDVTPHHLKYRAAGGGDELENVTTLCVWCHLRGIHLGRLRATPPASRIHWVIGRSGLLEVEGRTRLAS